MLQPGLTFHMIFQLKKNIFSFQVSDMNTWIIVTLILAVVIYNKNELYSMKFSGFILVTSTQGFSSCIFNDIQYLKIYILLYSTFNKYKKTICSIICLSFNKKQYFYTQTYSCLYYSENIPDINIFLFCPTQLPAKIVSFPKFGP